MKNEIRKIGIKAGVYITIAIMFFSTIVAIGNEQPIEENDEEQYVITFPHFYTTSRFNGNFNYLREYKITDMLVSTYKDPGFGHGVVYNSGKNIYQMNMDGQLELVVNLGDFGHGNLAHLANGLRDDWLIITDEGENYKAFYYKSTEDLQSNTYIASMSNVQVPLIGTVCEFTKSWNNRGFMWAEYCCITGYDSRIIKVIYTGGNNAEFSVKLTVPSETARHFHGMDTDIYNRGVYYAYMGDSNSQNRWFVSDDFGDTWELVEGSTGGQTYRTLRLCFTEDYIYWATDGYCENGYSQFLRASRNDISNPTILGNLSTTCLSYGSSLVWSPYGILVTLLAEGQTTVDTVPMFFYNLRTETLTKVFDWVVKDGYSKAGVHATMPYQNLYDGITWIKTIDANSEFHFKWDESSSIYLTKGLMIGKVS